MGVDAIWNFMSNPKMNLIFISEVGRSMSRLELNEILNEVLVKTGNKYLYSGSTDYYFFTSKNPKLPQIFALLRRQCNLFLLFCSILKSPLKLLLLKVWQMNRVWKADIFFMFNHCFIWFLSSRFLQPSKINTPCDKKFYLLFTVDEFHQRTFYCNSQK